MAVAAPRVQFAAPNQMGVTMSQLYYTVRDLEANRTFWVALGAVPVKVTDKQVLLTIPDVMISLNQGESLGNSEGSVLNHVAFQVPNIEQFLTKMRTAGYKTAGSISKEVGNVFSPEGERIELQEDRSDHAEITYADGKIVNGKAGGDKMTVPIVLHHIHFYVPEKFVGEVQSWYVKNFGAVSCKRWHYEAVDLPGININISGDANPLAPTKGRMLDRIGFEVKNLKAFSKKLQANGVKLAQPYTKQPSGLATAYLTDPWGNDIVLTEGLTRHY